MKKENSIFTKLVKNKRILFLTIIVLIAVFAMIINYAYASFISGNTDELLNTQVSELKYAYAINEKADSILYLRPNEEKAFDLIIKSLEEIDTKYEIIYENVMIEYVIDLRKLKKILKYIKVLYLKMK